MPLPPSAEAPDTEARILEAAHRVFTRRGVAAARTQEIADEAGVNKALLHYYFRTKERLSDAVFVRAAAQLFPQMLGALASDRPLREKLQIAVDAEMDMLDESPFLPGYILCELRSGPERLSTLLSEALPIQQVKARVFASLQAQLDEEAAAGHLRPITAEQLIVSMMSMLIFPHVAAHMLEAGLGLDASSRDGLAAWRRTELADFILRGFAP